MNGFLKQASLWIVLIIIVVLALTQLSKTQKAGEKLGRLDFVDQIEKSNVKAVVVKDLGDSLYEVQAKLKEPYKNSDTITFQWKDFLDDWDQKLTEQGIVPQMERDNNLWLGMLVGAAVLATLSILMRNVLILVLAVLVIAAVSGAGYLAVFLDRMTPAAQEPTTEVRAESLVPIQSFSGMDDQERRAYVCLLYTSPSPRDS